MTDDRSTGDRNPAPDFIPDQVVDEFEEIARVTVVSSRVLSDITRPSRLRLALDRFGPETAEDWLVPALAVAAAVVDVIWLAIAYESTAFFVMAALLTVLAIVSAPRWLWRYIRSR